MVQSLTNSVYGVLDTAPVRPATSDAYRGRVTSTYSTLRALTPIGGLQVGLPAMLFLNSGLILVCAGMLRIRSSLRDRLSDGAATGKRAWS